MFKRAFGSMSLVLALMALPASALASPAQDFVKAKQTELTELVKKSKSAEDKKLEGAFDAVLDYETLAHDTLREFWEERTPSERAEFQEALKKLVRNAYRKNLKRIGDFEVEYKGESNADSGQLVRTVAKNRSNAREEPVSIDYIVREVGGKWKITDIVTEGSSMVGNYRNQFRRIIKKQGFPELIKRMKTKLDKTDAE
ncbi:MAG TPA: ABC transporter substrate-binding protein [Polyangiaceae bacterium]|nr:ABC transporter substrate-binding protein [Polyangiaceae bacterium]